MSVEEKKLTLDITGSTPDNEFIVGLMNHFEIGFPYDYESIQRQLEFVVHYVIKKRYTPEAQLSLEKP